jgi:hypothetical protein
MVERPIVRGAPDDGPSSPSLYERRLDNDLVRASLTRELSTPHRGADHFVTKRHKQRGGYGWWIINQSPDRLGLINLNGTIVAPRPNRPWRQGR